MSTSTTHRATKHAGHDEPPVQRRRRRLLLALIVVAVLGLAALLTWIVAFSSLLGVRSVQVRGTHLLTATTVRATARVTTGTPLVRLDTAQITRRVETLPEVESAQVSTSFPSTVTISVVERTAVGYVENGGRADLLDRFGVHFRSVTAAPAGLPLFVLPGGANARSTGAAVATVAAALPASLRTSVHSIQALDPSSITLVLSHGRIVRWGGADRSAAKARILPVLLLKRSVSQVDVTDPDQPFTR